MKRPAKKQLWGVLALSVATGQATAGVVTSATLIASSMSPECLEYKVVGICYWLLCTPFGCKVKTSTKVRHFVPDAVVSSYSNTGENPWIEVSSLSSSTSFAQDGGDGTTNHNNGDGSTCRRCNHAPRAGPCLPATACTATARLLASWRSDRERSQNWQMARAHIHPQSELCGVSQLAPPCSSTGRRLRLSAVAALLLSAVAALLLL